MEVRVSGVEVKLSAKDIGQWLNDDPGALADLDRRGVAGQQAARSYVGVDTGTLLASIRKNRGTGVYGPYIDLIGGRPGLGYTGFHHDGTVPHVIRPVRAKALRWVGTGGQVVFRRSVFHPGTTGTFFLTRALRRMA